MSYTDAYINRIDGPDDNLKRSMRRIEMSLVGREDQFDAVLVTGLSGVIPAAIYCYMHDKQLVVVRKDHDVTHGVRTEGKDFFVPGTPYIIIDDFISGGSTQRRLYEKLAEFGFDLPKYTVLYRGSHHRSVTMLVNRDLKGYITGKRVNTREYLYTPRFSKDEDGDISLDWLTDYVKPYQEFNDR